MSTITDDEADAPMPDNLKERLLKLGEWLDADIGSDEPAGAIPREAHDRIEALERERDEARSVYGPMLEELQAICEAHGALGGVKRTDFIAERLATLQANLSLAIEALEAMTQRFELYAGPNDIHAGHHDAALLSRARTTLAKLRGEG